MRYDPTTKPHFHFIDEQTGRVEDLDPKLLKIIPHPDLLGTKFQISEMDVIVRGRRIHTPLSKTNEEIT